MNKSPLCLRSVPASILTAGSAAQEARRNWVERLYPKQGKSSAQILVFWCAKARRMRPELDQTFADVFCEEAETDSHSPAAKHPCDISR